MATIKFIRGLKGTYNAETHKDAIYFATDTFEILVNGTSYGASKALSESVVTGVSYTSTTNKLSFTTGKGPIEVELPLAGATDGLMSAEDKAALDALIGDGEGSVQDQIDAVKEIIDAYTVNGEAISTNPVLDGTHIQLTGYAQAGGATTAVAATDTVNQAIAKVENANTNTQNALEEFKGTVNQPNGIAGLDENGKIDPSLVDGVVGHVLGLEQFVENASLPAASVDNVGKYYFVTDENKIAECVENEGVYSWEKTDPQSQVLYNRRGADEQGHTNTLYRWDGSAMVAVSDPITIGETIGTAYDGAKGKANRDALNSAPNTVVTGFGLVTPAADSVSVAFTDSDKNRENNQYAAADGGNIVIPAATATTAGVMTAADKEYIEAVKDIIGEEAADLDLLTKSNAGIGELAGYTPAAEKAAIAAGDTINVAIGKLEKTLNDLTGGEGGSIQDQIQAAVDGIKGDATENGDTLGELEDRIETAEADIDQAQADITEIKAYTVNSKAINTNPVLGGGDIALTGYTTVDGGTVAATDTINGAINKLESSLVWYEA